MMLNVPELNDEQLKASQPHDLIPLLLSVNEHIAPQALSKGVITVIFNGLLMRTTTLSSEQRAQILDSVSTHHPTRRMLIQYAVVYLPRLGRHR